VRCQFGGSCPFFICPGDGIVDGEWPSCTSRAGFSCADVVVNSATQVSMKRRRKSCTGRHRRSRLSASSSVGQIVFGRMPNVALRGHLSSQYKTQAPELIRHNWTGFNKSAWDRLGTSHLPDDCRPPWRSTFRIFRRQERGAVPDHSASRVETKSAVRTECSKGVVTRSGPGPMRCCLHR
jgi:hypothetical protein